jgi:hypothetical protein
VTDQTNATTDLGASGTWDVVATSSNDILIFRSSTDDIMLVAGATGDDTSGFGTPFVVRTATQEPDVIALAVAAHTRTLPISASNPLGIAWQRAIGTGNGFVQLTGLAVSDVGTRASLPGAQGSEFSGFTLEVVPAPRSTSAHWYVVALDDDALTTSGASLVRVWEVIGNAESTRTVTVPGEVGATRGDVSVAMSGATIAIAEGNERERIVLRLLGCP